MEESLHVFVWIRERSIMSKAGETKRNLESKKIRDGRENLQFKVRANTRYGAKRWKAISDKGYVRRILFMKTEQERGNVENDI